MLGLQIRMDGEEGFSVFIAAVSSTSNVQFLLYGRLCWSYVRMKWNFQSFSIPKTINGAAGYAEPMKLEGCVLTEIIARIYWH